MSPLPRRCLQIAAFASATLVALRLTAQTTVSVTGAANIYGAGFASPPSPGGFGGGVLPTEFDLVGGTTVLTFTNVSGTVSFDQFNGPSNGADGGTGFAATTAVTATNSLSGISYNGRTAFLIGVFLDASIPSGTEPATLSYNDTSAGAASFSPLLRQTFFIGDGLDANAATQLFNVPAGATRLFLGFADAWNGVSVTGGPGHYSDNNGTLSVTVTAIPEPATVAFACGIGALGVAGWRRRKC